MPRALIDAEDVGLAIDCLCLPAREREGAVFSRAAWPGFPAGRPELYGWRARRRARARLSPSASLRAGRNAGRAALLLHDFDAAMRLLRDDFWKAQALALSGRRRRAFARLKSGSAADRLWLKLLTSNRALARRGGEAGLAARAFAGERLYLEGRFDSAAKRFAAIIRAEPACGWAWGLLGACRARRGRLEEARRHWRRAVLADPAFVVLFRLDRAGRMENILWQGQILFGELNFPRAEAALRRAAAMAPDDALPRAFLGRQLHFQGRSEEALAELDRAVRLEPGCAWIQAWRALSLEKARRRGEALRGYDASIRLDPYYAAAWAWRGALKRRLGRLRGAVRDLDRAVDCSGGPFNAALALACFERNRALWEAGDYENAFEDLARAARREPKFAAKPGAGLLELDRAVERMRDPKWALAWRGEAKLELGRPSEALVDLTSALRLDPGLAWAYAWRGEALRRLKRFDDARLDLNRAARLDPAFARTFAYRGLLHCELNDLPRAESDLTRALRHDGSDAPSYAWRGFVRISAKRWSQARSDLKRALSLRPDYAFARELYEKTRQTS